MRGDPQSRPGENVEYFSYNARKAKIKGKVCDVVRDGNVVGRYE